MLVEGEGDGGVDVDLNRDGYDDVDRDGDDGVSMDGWSRGPVAGMAMDGRFIREQYAIANVIAGTEG